MKRKQAITYIICFILTVILSFAKIKEFTPLSVGLCVALTLVGLNGMVVSTFAVAASCIEFSVASLVYSAAAAVVCIVFKFIAAKKKCPSGRMSVLHCSVKSVLRYIQLL